MFHREHVGGLRILARRGALTDKEFLKLIEERKDRIKPLLHEMTLQTIGELRIVDGAESPRIIRLSEPKVVGEYPLETRCVFHKPESGFREISTNHDFVYAQAGGPATGSVDRFWGLTRLGRWISIELVTEFSVTQKFRENPVRSGRAISVTVQGWHDDDLARLFQFTKQTPQSVWESLGRTIKAWCSHRESLFEQTRMLAKLVETEEEMAHVISL